MPNDDATSLTSVADVGEARILVVDDNPATLYSTSRVLRSAGWTTVTATTGTEAVELAQQGMDLVVLDVNLPDFDGFEVCRRLRHIDATARMPIVHLSATFVKDVDKVHGLQVGADGYLTHPVEPPVLIATVQAFLRARRAERETREVEARFKTVFDNAINGFALLSPRFIFLDVNPSMAALLGHARVNIIGRPIDDFIPPSGKAAAAQAHDLARAAGTWHGPLPVTRSDGQLLELEWSVSRQALPDGWLAVVSDITARVEFEKEREQLLNSERTARSEAERANRLKDDFLATLSHELRTPLNAIVGWSELLKMSSLDAEELREGIDAIERNAKAQAQLIADLLDVSRITSGKMRLDVQLVDFADVVDAALQPMLVAAEAKNIRLLKVLDPQAGPVSGDPSRLQQVVWNLVSNAVKFTPKGGKVQVKLARINSHVELTVADNGNGMSSELLPSVFERFRQGDSSSTRNYGGLGLGLAIVKQLVELHGGTIVASSPGLDLGSTFTVTLPVASVRSTTEQDWSRKSTTSSFADVPLTNISIVVVDDDEDARQLTSRVLKESGATTRVACNVDEALAIIDDQIPDVLVSDLGMPGRDGFDLIREIRARRLSPGTLPAVALTAFARTDDRRRALLAGFQIHLAKPVDPKELIAVVASLVERTRG